MKNPLTHLKRLDPPLTHLKCGTMGYANALKTNKFSGLVYQISQLTQWFLCPRVALTSHPVTGYYINITTLYLLYNNYGIAGIKARSPHQPWVSSSPPIWDNSWVRHGLNRKKPQYLTTCLSTVTLKIVSESLITVLRHYRLNMAQTNRFRSEKYRLKMRSNGFRPHQIWCTDEAWPTIRDRIEQTRLNHLRHQADLEKKGKL